MGETLLTTPWDFFLSFFETQYAYVHALSSRAALVLFFNAYFNGRTEPWIARLGQILQSRVSG